jgi:hypothetical protein
VKKEIKQEIKPEIKSEPPCTPTPAGKRARSFSVEMPIRKCPGIIKRTQKKALEALGPLEDDGELEPLEKLLSGDAGEVNAGRDSYIKVHKLTAYRSGTQVGLQHRSPSYLLVNRGTV